MASFSAQSALVVPTSRHSEQERRKMQPPIIAEAKELIGFALHIIAGLRAAEQRLSIASEYDEERSWVTSAERRIQRAITGVEAALEAAFELPEFEAERQKKGAALFEAWVEAVEGLYLSISSQASPNSPLIEVIFPHQKFDKLRKGGTAARAYLAEVERRRRASYVVRLASEPEYAFSRAPFARLEAARAAHERHEQPIELAEEDQLALRDTVRVASDELRAVLHQARLLAEAALNAHPGGLAELGLDAKPRKKATRGASGSPDPRSVEPAGGEPS
jgi:hypothetical protein